MYVYEQPSDGKIELAKVWSGTAGDATLSIGTTVGGSQIATGTANGANGTTGEQLVPTGTYYVSETVDPTPNYSSLLACVDTANGNAGVPVGADNAVTVSPDSDVVCTFTNSRLTGKIELAKVWSGTPGNATLRIGTTLGGSEVAIGTANGASGTTGEHIVPTGKYYLSETVDPAASFGPQLACVDSANGNAALAVDTDNAVSVAADADVVCTLTNSRLTGEIELAKIWSGTPGDATLRIGTTVGGSEVATGTANGANGSTGEKTVLAGTYYVSETVDPAQQYGSLLACIDTANGNANVPIRANNAVSVAASSDVVCTFTNSRLTGKIELTKVWSGTPGNASLRIGTTVGGSQIATGTANGASGTTGEQTVPTGTYYLSETVDPAANYGSLLACVDTANGNANVSVGADNSVSVAANADVVCTFTNSRLTGTVELTKVWSGTPGNASLRIGTTVGGSQVATGTANGANGTTGEQTVPTGTYYLSETVDPAVNYASVLSCVDTANGNAAVPLGPNDAVLVTANADVVCTFTNSRLTGKIELAKVWSGTAGNAILRIGTTAGGADVATGSANGANGTTGEHTVPTGTYYLSEFVSVLPYPAYQSSVSCVDGSRNGAAVPLGVDNAVSVANGADVVCTYTNVASERLYSGSQVPPSSIAIGSLYAVETAQRVNFSCAGTVSGLWWYRTASDTGTNTVSMWRGGALLAEASGSPASTGWVFLQFASPVSVSSGDQVVVGVHHPNGAYAYTLNGFTNRSVVSSSGCMTAPATGSGAPNGLYVYSGAPVLPTLSYAATEYWISPDFERATTPVPPANERLYSGSQVPPSSIAIGSAYAVETAQRVNFSCAGTVSGLWWYRTASDTGTNTVSMWRGGALLAEASGSPASTGWVFLQFASPVSVSSGDQVVVGVHHPNGAYAYTLNGFTNRSVVSSSGCMTAPATGSGAPNGLYVYSGAPVLPTLSYAATEYWISPDFERATTPGPTTTTSTTSTTTSSTTTTSTTTTSSTTTTTTSTTLPPTGGGGERIYALAQVPPSSIAIGSAYAVETAQRVNFSCAGTVSGLWWYRTASDTGTNTVSMWRGGALLAEASGSPASTGWVFLQFASPVSVSSGDQVVVGVHHPNGAYAYTLNGFTNRSVVSSSGCMTAPATGSGAPNGLYSYTATALLPTLSYAATEYWISPDFERTTP